MFDALQKIAGTGQRLAEAGRRARTEVEAAAGPVGGKVAATAAAAAGELVRCAVAGAISAMVRGPQRQRVPRRVSGDELWPDSDEYEPVDEMDDLPNSEPLAPVLNVTPTDHPTENESGWVRGARAVSSALTVAAGAAVSVPGGRLVAAGLGAAAAVAALAARVNEPTSEV